MAATLHQNGAEGKLEEICFLNTYPTVVEEDPEDGDEKKRADRPPEPACRTSGFTIFVVLWR